MYTDGEPRSELLTLDEKDPKRLFEGNALIRRLVRIGVLDESRMKLDYVLALRVEDFLERRLQTCVYKLGLAKSIHHARVLIRQRHIRYEPTVNRFAGRRYGMLISDVTVSASRLSTCLLTWSVSTPRSTLTSPSPRRSVVAALAVSAGRRPVLLRVVVKRPVRRKRSKLKNGIPTGVFLKGVSKRLQHNIKCCTVMKSVRIKAVQPDSLSARALVYNSFCVSLPGSTSTHKLTSLNAVFLVSHNISYRKEPIAI